MTKAWTVSLIIFQLLFFNLHAQDSRNPIAIKNITIIDGTGAKPEKNTDLVIKNGKIFCVGDCEEPINAQIIDGTGKYLIPGLIDCHVHYSISGWLDSFPIPNIPDVSEKYPYHETLLDLKNNPERFHKSYLCSGVTAVFDTGGFPWLFEIRDNIDKTYQTPHYYTTGPLLSFEEFIFPNNRIADDFLFSINSKQNMIKGLHFLIDNNADAVNIHNVHNIENMDTLKKRLDYIERETNKAGIKSMVFSRGLEEAKLAIQKGVEILIYSIEEEIVDDEFLKLAKENDIIYVPTLGVSDGLRNAFSGDFPYEHLSLECVDGVTLKKIEETPNYYSELVKKENKGRSNILPDGTNKTEQIRNENLRIIHDAGIKVAMGSSAGVPFLIHGPSSHQEMIAMQNAGLSPMEILIASTRNGALLMDNPLIGTVEKGKIADLVILDKNPLENIKNIKDINLVIRGGVIVQ